LGFAPKPHPTIFIENEPDAVFDGLEKFQKTNGLDVDGAVKNKDSESGRALNAAMEEFYNPSARRQADAGRKMGRTQNSGQKIVKLPKKVLKIGSYKKLSELREKSRRRNGI